MKAKAGIAGSSFCAFSSLELYLDFFLGPGYRVHQSRLVFLAPTLSSPISSSPNLPASRTRARCGAAVVRLEAGRPISSAGRSRGSVRQRPHIPISLAFIIIGRQSNRLDESSTGPTLCPQNSYLRARLCRHRMASLSVMQLAIDMTDSWDGASWLPGTSASTMVSAAARGATADATSSTARPQHRDAVMTCGQKKGDVSGHVHSTRHSRKQQ